MPNWNRLQPALEVIAERLAHVEACWLVGGSTGLLMQDVALSAEPRDLDLYVDRGNVRKLHEALKDFAIDEPQYSETPMYASHLSHYDIGGVQVELVGSLEVNRGTAQYEVEAEAVMAPFAVSMPFGGFRVLVMPLVHELVFNVMRERSDRYIPIADMIRQQVEAHRLIWERLSERNRIEAPYRNVLRELLPELLQEG